MTDAPAQRAWRAACPGCGAPVDFRSAASTHAVCGYCQSLVVRDGEALARLGKMADLFDDHSPLRLGASGRYGERGFTVVGRLQVRTSAGVFSEWRALFDDNGAEAWLSEDNGRYVFGQTAALQRAAPAPEHLRTGLTTAVGGRSFTVASNEPTARLIAAEGELPRLPALGQAFALVELRNPQGEVLTLDYGSQPPAVTLGREVDLDSLRMSGLREDSVREQRGRQFACPACGSPVSLALPGSKSVTCGACHSLIDVSSPEAGVGGELHHALQDEPVQPLIALGSTGTFEGKPWQVVGFQHRLGTEPGDDDEHFGWDEYLLYNARAGFAFLVDATDGWSLYKPLVGAPEYERGATRAVWKGERYAQTEAYFAQATWVVGEFYWQVQRGQRTWNQEFANGRRLLSREETGSEIVWSSGYRVASDLVARSFGLADRRELMRRADAAPASSAGGHHLVVTVVMLVLIVVLLLALSRCSRCDPAVERCDSSTSRSSGGSFGGWSGGGGGHK